MTLSTYFALDEKYGPLMIGWQDKGGFVTCVYGEPDLPSNRDQWMMYLCYRPIIDQRGRPRAFGNVIGLMRRAKYHLLTELT